MLDIDKDSQQTVLTKEGSIVDINSVEWIALYIPPSLYLTASNLVVVDKIRRCTKSKIILSSTGFSALMAALFAKYQAIQKVEWKMYRLSKILEGSKPFSKSWKKELSYFIDETFKNEYFSDLKVPLVINLYAQDGQVTEHYKGKLAPILKAALNIEDFLGNNFDPSRFNKIFNSRYIDRLAKDWKILLNSHYSKFIFKYDRGYLWGKYSQISQHIKNDPNAFYNTFDITNKLAIDDLSNLSKFFGKHMNQEQICQLLIKNKKTGSDSSN